MRKTPTCQRPRKKMDELLIECHERFFDVIDSVLHMIFFDNSKTVQIDRNTDGYGQYRFHAGFREFVKHYGFSLHMRAPE